MTDEQLAQLERQREYGRRYRAKNLDKIRARQRERKRKIRAENPELHREKQRAYRKANPEKIRELYRKWCQRNRERKNELEREWRARNIEVVRRREPAYARKWLYGLSVSDFEAMLEAQGRKCAICEKEFTKSPNVDHDHETGKIRGLLCVSCNTRLGFVEFHLLKIVDYLFGPEKP